MHLQSLVHVILPHHPTKRHQLHSEWNSLIKPPSTTFSRNFSTARRNQSKNRYTDVLPFDDSRVTVGDAYINASYIVLPKNKYIACQAPLPSTFNVFWEMIWNDDVPLIVMLTKLVEQGKMKAHCYWPTENEGEVTFGNISVTMVKQVTDANSVVIKYFKLKKDDIEKTVAHIHYQLWPDFGVPEDTHTLLQLQKTIIDIRGNPATKSGLHAPVVIHCSAGIGRTGTMLALMTFEEYAQMGTDLNDICIRDIVNSLRKQRMGMVQTEEQYRFIYQLVSDYIKTRPELAQNQNIKMSNWRNLSDSAANSCLRSPEVALLKLRKATLGVRHRVLL